MPVSTLETDLETKSNFFETNESFYTKKDEFQFPKGINLSDLKKTLENQFQKEYFLFAKENSRIIFSKAPLRGNTVYGFWIDSRLEEITEEIEYFSKIDSEKQKSNMLNILLTIDRNGLGINQADSWNVFKDELTKYITRIKRVCKERFGINPIGHFRVLEAHQSGHCHAHICLILDESIDYELKRKYNPKTKRVSFVGELKDKNLETELMNWHFSNNASIGKESITAVYSSGRLIDYLTKYFGKNQTFMQNSYNQLMSMNYDFENDKTANQKLNSDLKKILGFYYSIKTNVRLFRHSIQKDFRQNYLEHKNKILEAIQTMAGHGLSVEKVAETLKISVRRVVRLFFSVSHSLANETQSNLHESFRSSDLREYLGVVSKKMLENLFEISGLDKKSAYKNQYTEKMTKEEKEKKLEKESFKKCDEFFDSKGLKVEKEKEVIDFEIDISNSPVIQAFCGLKEEFDKHGKKLSLSRFINDFYTWREKGQRQNKEIRENVKMFLEDFPEILKNRRKKKIKKIREMVRRERGF